MKLWQSLLVFHAKFENLSHQDFYCIFMGEYSNFASFGHLGVQSGQPRVRKNFEAILCLCFVKNCFVHFFHRFMIGTSNIFAFSSIVYLLYLSRKSGLKKNTFFYRPLFAQQRETSIPRGFLRLSSISLKLFIGA